LPKGAPTALSARALPDGAIVGEASVQVAALPGLEHILVDARGRQHVVLRGNGAAVQLMIEGSDVASGPVTLRFCVRGLAAIQDACRELALIRRVLSPPPRYPTLPGWTMSALRLRNALLALDGHAAGANYREIAVVLHGPDYVTHSWVLGLKERVRRDLERGLLLAGGGYRDLLR
jgi:hypothetical protein